MAASTTPTTELSSRDDLTQLHANSGLLRELYEPRIRDSDGYILNSEVFAGFDLIKKPVGPVKKPRSSHIWHHGFTVQNRVNKRLFWACRYCNDQARVTKYCAKSTAHAADHLRQAHRITKRGLQATTHSIGHRFNHGTIIA